VRWVRDQTRRFPKRPHYETHELDSACAELARDILRTRHAEAAYPITTDDLSVLIEQRAADLDLYADLSGEGADVEGVTDFAPGARPRVRVSATLTEDPRRTPRLRTTLAHELAHVVFHDFIWWFDQGTLDATRAAALSPRCHRQRVVGATDWMEWQANYASGALLMPADALSALFPADGAWLRSEAGRARVRQVQKAFAVSAPAASLRLLQLGYLSQRPRLIVRSPTPR
jgi:Zn-dependent peptidase ImmA (M78 family)